MRIAGAVVLYHPDGDVFLNIESYRPELGKLYVLDNSERAEEAVALRLRELPYVEYIPYGENRGISVALNDALARAEADGFDWLLTMDQDSRFEAGDFRKYLTAAGEFLSRNEKAEGKQPLAAVIGTGFTEMGRQYKAPEEKVEALITSGSLVRISMAREIGGFDEKLFIDEVDNEYCYRAKKAGYGCYLLNAVTMIHHLGNPKVVTAGGVYLFKALGHPAIRKYYIMRNQVYVMKLYPHLRGHCLKSMTKTFIKVILAETGKVKKIRFMLRGIRDGLLGRMGKMKD